MKISKVEEYTKKERKHIIDDLVKLHISAFPSFFLTSMGKGFLQQLYFGFSEQPNGILLIAEDNGNAIGFAAGTIDPDKFFKTLLRTQGLRFAISTIPGLLRNPVFVIRKCVGALFYRGETPSEIPNAALLSSLAVAPSSAGKGIGQLLVKRFCEDVRKQGCKSVYLTTDEAENENANRFYAKCGFILLDTIERAGNRTMNRWVMKL